MFSVTIDGIAQEAMSGERLIDVQSIPYRSKPYEEDRTNPF